MEGEYITPIVNFSFDSDHFRLEMMFDKAEQRSEELESSYSLLDRWKNKTEELLYSMIPQTVADRLRAGVSPMSTCEVIASRTLSLEIFRHLRMSATSVVTFFTTFQSFDSITILFCDLCDFDCNADCAMEIVSTMNTVFSTFDAILDKFNVYKVKI